MGNWYVMETWGGWALKLWDSPGHDGFFTDKDDADRECSKRNNPYWEGGQP